MNRLLNLLSPFIILGLVLAVLIFGAILMGYLLLFGAIIALVIFVIKKIRAWFSPKKPIPKQNKKTGRIIDADDWNVL